MHFVFNCLIFYIFIDTIVLGLNNLNDPNCEHNSLKTINVNGSKLIEIAVHYPRQKACHS